MSWIKCQSGALLNTDNIIMLKAHKGNCVVQAECVGNRTVDIEQCADRDEATVKCYELAGMKANIPAPKKKPEIQKPRANKAKAKAPRKPTK